MSTARSTTALRKLLEVCRNTRRKNNNEIRRLKAQLVTANKRLDAAVSLINTMMPACQMNPMIQKALLDFSKTANQRGCYKHVTKPRTTY